MPTPTILARYATAALAALLLAACTGSDSETPAATSGGTSGGTATSGSMGTADGAGDEVDAGAAVELAAETVPGAVVELSSGTENDVPVWEVDVLGQDDSGVEVYVDTRSGEVVRQRPTDLDSDQRPAPAITAVEAIDIALGAGDGRVVEMDLDTDKGVRVWEVDVVASTGGIEFFIDAETGDIVKQEPRN